MKLTVGAKLFEGGVLHFDDRGSMLRLLRRFSVGIGLEGMRVTVTIEADRGTRSTKQNRYYRLILGLISEHTGHDADELHEYFKHKFLQPQTMTVLGQEIEVWTTTKENPKSFSDYTEDVRRFALTDLGVETPDPYATV